MKLDDLWIGDLLLQLSSGKKGSFEGKADKDHALVKINGEIIKIHVSDLEATEETEPAPVIEEEDIEFEDSNKSLYFDTTIDLHIEILKPELQHSRVEQILNYQLRAAKFFIEKAIFLRKNHITIIHGKGVGLLKLEVMNLLKSFDEVHHILEQNQGGSAEVYFKY